MTARISCAVCHCEATTIRMAQRVARGLVPVWRRALCPIGPCTCHSATWDVIHLSPVHRTLTVQPERDAE